MQIIRSFTQAATVGLLSEAHNSLCSRGTISWLTQTFSQTGIWEEKNFTVLYMYCTCEK